SAPESFMPFRLSCPGCASVFNLGDDLVGKQARCTACGKVFQVSRGPVPAPPADARVTRAPAHSAAPRPLPPQAGNPSADAAAPARAAASGPGLGGREGVPQRRRSFLWVGLLGAGVLLAAGGATVAALLLLNPRPAPTPVAKEPEDKRPPGEA